MLALNVYLRPRWLLATVRDYSPLHARCMEHAHVSEGKAICLSRLGCLISQLYFYQRCAIEQATPGACVILQILGWYLWIKCTIHADFCRRWRSFQSDQAQSKLAS